MPKADGNGALVAEIAMQAQYFALHARLCKQLEVGSGLGRAIVDEHESRPWATRCRRAESCDKNLKRGPVVKHRHDYGRPRPGGISLNTDRQFLRLPPR